MLPQVAREGEILFRHRCPSDGQRVKVRFRGARQWSESVWTYNARLSMVRSDGCAPGRTVRIELLTAWLPAEEGS